MMGRIGKTIFPKYLILNLIVAIVLLSACSKPASANNTPTPSIETNTVEPTIISSFTASPTFTISSTATPRTETYQTKKPLVVYGSEYRTEWSLNFLERGYFSMPQFLLYDDGQLIIRDTKGLQEKKLSKSETEEVINELSQIGFFQLQATYEADPGNALYNLPPSISEGSEIGSTVISINNGQGKKEIRYRRYWEEYLIQPMKDILFYLNNFPANNTIPYLPNRLFVSVDLNGTKSIKEDETAILWPDDVASPLNPAWDGVLYLEGSEAEQIYLAMMANDTSIVEYQDKKYYIWIRPIYPHECSVLHFDSQNNIPDAQTFFYCDE